MRSMLEFNSSDVSGSGKLFKSSHFAIFPLGIYFDLATSLTMELTLQFKENCF